MKKNPHEKCSQKKPTDIITHTKKAHKEIFPRWKMPRRNKTHTENNPTRKKAHDEKLEKPTKLVGPLP